MKNLCPKQISCFDCEKYTGYCGDDCEDKIKLNNKEFARQNPRIKKHIIFHGGCLGCIVPKKYGIGNCVGCLYFNGVTSSFPDLGIRNL